MTVNSYTNIVRAMLLTFQNNLIDLFKQNPKIMRSPKKKFLEYAGELHIIVLREEKNGPVQLYPTTPDRAVGGSWNKVFLTNKNTHCGWDLTNTLTAYLPCR